MSARLFTYTMECDGRCGAKIEVTTRAKGDPTDAAAEALGWATVDRGKKTLVYCPECQGEARHVVKTIGP